MNEKLNIQSIAELFAEKHGMDKKAAESFVKTFFQLVEESLEADKYVKIKGLGTFKLIDVESRESVNINTGERFEIQGHTKVSFTPDSSLKEMINKPFSHFETVVINDGAVLEDTPIEGGSEEEVIEEIESATEIVPIEDTESATEAEPVDDEMAEEAKLVVENIESESTTDTESIDESTEVEPIADAEPISENIEASEDIEQVVDIEPAADVGSIVEETVEPIIEETVEPIIEETVEPIVEETVEPTIEETVEPIVEETVEPIIEETVEPTIEETVEHEPFSFEPAAPLDEPVDEKDSSMKFFICIVVIVVALSLGAIAFIYYPDLLQDIVLPTNKTDDIEIGKTDEPASSVSSSAQQDAEFIVKAKEEPTETIPQTNAAKHPTASTAATTTSKPATVASPSSAEKKTSISPKQNSDKPAAFEPDSVNYKIVGTKGAHTVAEGETLTRIALRFYGTKALWPYIVKHNSDVIKKPDNVPVGTTLKIPELVKK